MDLKAHVLQGKEFHYIRLLVVLVLFAAAVLVTTAASYLNAAFAFAISTARSPAAANRLRGGASMPEPFCAGEQAPVSRFGLPPSWRHDGGAAGSRSCWDQGIVLGVLMVCYVAVPARIVGVGTGKTANAAQSGRDKLAAAAVSGVLGALFAHRLTGSCANFVMGHGG